MDYPQYLDGLILLQGRRGHQPAILRRSRSKPSGPGDRLRDAYEMELLHEFMEEGNPSWASAGVPN